MNVIGGDDGVGVVPAVFIDVGNRLVHTLHHLDADDGGEVFFVPVLFGYLGNCYIFSSCLRRY